MLTDFNMRGLNCRPEESDHGSRSRRLPGFPPSDAHFRGDLRAELRIAEDGTL